VRVDHALAPGYVVGSTFDSLLAKVIVTGPTWDSVVRKARRALDEVIMEGVQTNLVALRGIVAHQDFAKGDCDTRWLESHVDKILQLGAQPVVRARLPEPTVASPAQQAVAAIASGTPIFRKGDAWTVDLTPLDGPDDARPTKNHLSLTRILRNDFPSSLVSEIEFTAPSGNTTEFKLTLASTSSSAGAVTSQHRRGDPNNPRHIVIPLAGKLVEVLVDEGDVIRADEVICVVQQMKMEIEIRAKRAGRVVWVTEIEDGEEVTDGILAAEIDPIDDKEAAKL
jgi:acetyl/propionyl-CoA carboxylase alpha subunit